MNIFSGHFWSFSVCRNQEIINDKTFRGAVVWCVVSTMNTPCWWYSGSWHSGAGSYFHNVTALSCGHLHNPVLLSSTHHGTVSAVSRVGWHPLIMGWVSEVSDLFIGCRIIANLLFCASIYILSAAHPTIFRRCAGGRVLVSALNGLTGNCRLVPGTGTRGNPLK